MNRTAKIYVENNLAGELIEEVEGDYTFLYSSDYLEDPFSKNVSLTLPKRSDVYRSATLFPFFDGLIPEGWLLDLGIINWKLNPHDRMGLLLTLCKDCIGNVSVISYDE